jgi:hypothetical protein
MLMVGGVLRLGNSAALTQRKVPGGLSPQVRPVVGTASPPCSRSRSIVDIVRVLTVLPRNA